MKSIVKLIGLLVLIGFSFFYTDKVIEVIREEDEIMIILSSKEEVRISWMRFTIFFACTKGANHEKSNIIDFITISSIQL